MFDAKLFFFCKSTQFPISTFAKKNLKTLKHIFASRPFEMKQLICLLKLHKDTQGALLLEK
jgi:hypothetical protein